MANFQTFRQEWTGRRIDFDKIYQYQCVDLILEYIYECYGIGSGVSGNAIDYWNKPSPALLKKFYKVNGSDAHEGDIVVFKGTPANSDGHIGIATGALGAAEIEILEQNGGGGGDGLAKPGGVHWDEIGTRSLPRTHVAGLLRPNVDAGVPAPAPKPAPPAPAPAPEAYLVVKPIPGYPTANDAANHTNKADTVNGGTYNIFNKADGMVNVTAKAGVAGSWINPGDNVAYSSTSLQGSAIASVGKPSYQLKNTVMGFSTANDAVNHKNAKSTVSPGRYAIYNQRYDMLNLTKDPATPGSWVNPADDVPTPLPSPAPVPVTAPPATAPVVTPVTPATAANPNQWKSTYTPLRNDRKGVKFTMLFAYGAYDYNDFDPISGHPIGSPHTIPAGTSIVFYGTFIGPDDKKYWRPKLVDDTGFVRYIGVPLSTTINGIPELLFEEQQLLLTQADLDYHRPGQSEVSKVVAAAEKLDAGIKNAVKVIDGFRKPRR